MADQESNRDSTAGKGLFDFTFSEEAAEKSDGWNISSTSAKPDQSSQKKSWFPKRDLFGQDEPSPAVVRTRQGSHALQRRSGVGDRSGAAVDRLDRRIKDLDDVISRDSPRARSLQTVTPQMRSRFSGVDTPPTFSLASKQFETPKASVTIMDETGMTQEFFVDTRTPARNQDVTFMGTATDVSSRTGNRTLDTTLFGGPSRPSDSDTVLLEDPAEKTSRDLVQVFHSCLSSHPHAADILELAQSLEKACEDEIELLKEMEEQVKGSRGNKFPQLLLELNLERCTWQLLHILYTDRVESERCGEEEEEAMITDILTGDRSDKQIAEDFFKDSSVRQAQLVVDWLEKNAEVNLEKYPVKVNYFADSVMWENTLHCIQRNIDTDKLVTKMDPDAPTREGKHLAELDKKDEQSLVRHLFTCVRAGQLAKAQELCVQCGQSWRAATLEGWKLHHDPNRGKDLQVDDLESVEGNLSRDLWKITCWEMANDPYFSVHEKAIYAALSGNIKHILPACNSWLDYVWAYFKVLVDVLTEKRLRSCSPATGQVMETMPEEYWNAILIPEVILQEIEASPSLVIQRESKNHFHVAQKHIILGNLNDLVVAMHSWLKDNPKVYMLRFMAHLVLFVRGLDATVEEDFCDQIMEAYIKELTRLKFNHVVALYTSRLSPSLQVSCYANLLQGIEDAGEQKRLLDLGKEAGLELAVITKTVVEHIRNIGVDEAAAPSPLVVGGLSEGEITKLDSAKIEVIKWLVFEESQRAEAIRQGNALMRLFLATGKHTAAQAVLGQIPADSVEVVVRNWQMKVGDQPLTPAMADDIQEYHGFQAYFEANDAFNSWFDYFHNKKPECPPEPVTEGDFRDNVAYDHKVKQYKMEESQWKTHLFHLTEEVEAKLTNVLLFPGGWMVPAYDAPFNADEERRSTQLNHLRVICIPQLCFLLHTALHSTGLYRKCLQLADIIASEEFQLYKVFRQVELEKLLSLLHSSACADLNEPHTELGYPH